MVLRGGETQAAVLNGAAIKARLKKIVPEYTPFFKNCTVA